MITQNITLSLPKRTLMKIKVIAARRQTSVSALVTEALEEIVAQETGYDWARRRQAALLDRGLNLDTGGELSFSREELHER